MTVVFDYDRVKQLGMPEAVLCEGKTTESLNHIILELRDRRDHPVLFTRLFAAQFKSLDVTLSGLLDYEPVSATALLNGKMPPREGRVAVVTAGTADLKVAREAERTLAFMGVTCTLFVDVGVAGLWRVLERIEEIRAHDIVIAIAGMDAALASVLGGRSASLHRRTDIGRLRRFRRRHHGASFDARELRTRGAGDEHRQWLRRGVRRDPRPERAPFRLVAGAPEAGCRGACLTASC